jgi:hypothetical protein
MMIPTLDPLVSESRVAKVLSFAKLFPVTTSAVEDDLPAPELLSQNLKAVRLRVRQAISPISALDWEISSNPRPTSPDVLTTPV